MRTKGIFAIAVLCLLVLYVWGYFKVSRVVGLPAGPTFSASVREFPEPWQRIYRPAGWLEEKVRAQKGSQRWDVLFR